MPRYPYAGDDWFTVPKRGFRLKCCGCSLVHEIDFKIVNGGEIQMRIKRHERATSAARRAIRKKVLIVDEGA
jgi:hypothetical protein